MTVYEYARLDENEKVALLLKEGNFLEEYDDGPFSIRVYHLHEFFVEIMMAGSVIIENLPYKRGYRLPDEKSESKSVILYFLAA